MTTLQSLELTLPELILSLGAIALMLVAAFGGDKAARAVTWAAIALLAFAAVSACMTSGVAFKGLYTADAFAAFAKILVFGSAAVALMMSPRWFTQEERFRSEYAVLVLFAATGMGMMVSATNLMSLYIGIELNSLSAYVLASFVRKDLRTAEAGLKYFVLEIGRAHV